MLWKRCDIKNSLYNTYKASLYKGKWKSQTPFHVFDLLNCFLCVYKLMCNEIKRYQIATHNAIKN